MTDKEIPTYRCTYCLQAIPEDTHQHLFGVNLLNPKSDEADNFVAEAQTILNYAAAVVCVIDAAEKVDESVRYELQRLMGELTDEVLRRLERAQEALEIVWEWEEAAKKAPHARKEG